MKVRRVSVVSFALLISAATVCDAQSANDFPTLDRVLFVEGCVRDHTDRSHQEMIYKCSCAVDVLAAELHYDEFVELSTAMDAGQIAGERGTAVRDSEQGKDMTKRFKIARAKAYDSCFIK